MKLPIFNAFMAGGIFALAYVNLVAEIPVPNMPAWQCVLAMIVSVGAAVISGFHIIEWAAKQ